MFRQALSEIRLYPGRFVATLIAIAISVGFMSAISVLVATEEASLGKANSMALAKADLAVVQEYGLAPEVADAVRGVPGVQTAQLAAQLPAMLTANDRTVTASIWLDLQPEFRWAKLVEGEYPDAVGELAVARDMAEELGVGLGDTVNLSEEMRLTVVGITDDAKTLWGTTAYASVGDQSFAFGDAIPIVLADGADADQVRGDVERAVAPLASEARVLPADEAREEALISTTRDFDVFRYMLYTFAAIAVLVGMITIANTFTILVTQRRRQIGLLRAVGASSGQVLGRQVIESMLLGILGSLLGIALGFVVAWIGASFTGSAYWGLTVRWGELLIALLVGTAATMVSAIGPAIAATRVKPLEALQAVPTAAEAKRASMARIVICSLFLLAGAGLVFLSQQPNEEASMNNMLYAVGAGVLLTIGILGAAPLFVAPLLRVIGKALGFAGPTTRLAFENSARNPRRAAATATALMLAIGLIVTLQVALSSARTTAMDEINKTYPLDISAEYADSMPEGVAERVDAIDGVQSVALMRGKRVEIEGWGQMLAVDQYEARRAMGVEATQVPDGVVQFSSEMGPSAGESVTINGATYTVQKVGLYSWSTVGLNQAAIESLPGEWVDAVLWVKFTDRTSSTTLNQVMKVLSADDQMPDLSQSGAQMASLLQQVLDVVVLVMTALLGVAVLIAIVGVGNTLGLSVLERQRESALLRALGMQRGQLRLMLLIEALALVGIGAVIGVLAGLFFGWLGVSTMFASIPETSIDMRITIDPLWTFGLIGVCLVAACLASILPGRRAANATPTEALAVD